MKKQLNILLVLIALITVQVHTQPQWKFHIAYEDATGAKDTIWFIWDTTATFLGADTALGEVTASIDTTKFSVWTYNAGLTWPDTIKIVAHPYIYSFGHYIYAINFELPIKISWDTAMLHTDWLPPEPVGWVNYARIQNDYFFSYGNMEMDHFFDMTITNQVTAPSEGNNDPWVWQDWVHFPMAIFLIQDPTLSTEPKINAYSNSLTAYPNPFTESTTFEFNLKEPSQVELSVYNLQGKFVKTISNKYLKGGFHKIKWSGLDSASQNCLPGVYLVSLKVNGQQVSTQKILKQE